MSGSFEELIQDLSGTGPSSAPPAQGVRQTTGTVKAVNSDGTLSVAIDGNSAGAPAVRYDSVRNIAVGDLVDVEVRGGVLIVRGRFARSALSDVGTIVDFPFAPPTGCGYLKADGSSFSGTTYPALAVVYPSLVLPDLRDLFLVGAGSTYSIGAWVGSASVSLSVANLPPHSHSVSGSQTGFYWESGTGGFNIGTTPGGDALSSQPVIGNTGSGSPVSILPPAQAVYHCVKAL